MGLFIINNTQKTNIPMEEVLKRIEERLTKIEERLTKIEETVYAKTTEQSNTKNEIDQRLEEVKSSINRFIEKASELNEDEVNSAIETYSKKLRQYYVRQDFAENSIASMKKRVAKARQNGTKILTTTKVVESKFVMPEWLKPSITVSVYQPKADVVMYCQTANQMLADEYVKPEYRHYIQAYIDWYIVDLLDNFAPAVAKKDGVSIEQAEDWVCMIWSKECPHFLPSGLK